LAMSSRNRYLTAEQRPRALSLWQALQAAKQLYLSGQRSIQVLEMEMRRVLQARGADRIDYARVVEARSLTDIDFIDVPAVALVAAHVGQTRLIDNVLLDDPS
jgi:pantoate--beta-alanine ligase